MTAQQTSRSRRAVLAGAIGGLVGVAASALGRPELVRAGADGDVVLGGLNSTTTTTIIENGISDQLPLPPAAADYPVGFYGRAGSPGTPATGVLGWAYTGCGVEGIAIVGSGVYGYSEADVGVSGGSGKRTGVFGSSLSGTGVSGSSLSGAGMDGLSHTGVAVRGTSLGASVPALEGLARGNNTGVYGYSGSGALPAGPSKTGVFGYAAQDTSAIGVRGKSTSGRGVQGEATTGIAIRASAGSGTGVYATSTTGLALRTSGRVSLGKASGVATIAASKTAVRVNPGLDVTTTSFVLLTPKGSLRGRDLWCTTDATNNSITIRVSSPVASNLAVGWLLLG